ncbi:Caudovirales tail fiber assembly protein [Caballeronia glebae]|uniref:Caudovirales tail fiber assembly protein n=2 Tax=Caballeronia glebae TaxID=1777143 RepID=A0A158D4X6_9BURK|nr:Caudovirales tail fiber assembly protein [Caballeronia glebae]
MSFPTPDQIKLQNTAMRDSLLALAKNAIVSFQDAVDPDEANNAENALLKQWKQFRVAVNRVDFTLTSPNSLGR